MKTKQLDMVSMVEIIELPPSCLSFLGKPNSTDVLKQRIDDFKELVKSQRRKLAVKYHPDKGGDTERMKEINDICDLLLKIEVLPPRPPLVSVKFSFGWGVGSEETTGTNFTGRYSYRGMGQWLY